MYQLLDEFHWISPLPGAAEVRTNLRQLMGTTAPTTEGATRAWATVHPERPNFAETYVVDSALMDALSPPRGIWDAWILDEFLTGVAKASTREVAQHREVLEAVCLRASRARVDRETAERILELERDLGIMSGAIRRLLRRAKARVHTSKLGLCLTLTDGVRSLLDKHFDRDRLGTAAHREAVCVLDCERIVRTGKMLARAADGVPYKWFEPGRLGWAVWFHEQSHSTRPLVGTSEEEVMAQLEAYRLLRDLAKERLGNSAGAIDLMIRLARRQPPPYRVVLDGRLLRRVGLA